jgi:hypothetical protein
MLLACRFSINLYWGIAYVVAAREPLVLAAEYSTRCVLIPGLLLQLAHDSNVCIDQPISLTTLLVRM